MKKIKLSKRQKDIIETLAYIVLGYLIAVGANAALGFFMNTDYPVVAVVSGSMEHDTINSYHTWFVDRKYDEADMNEWSFRNGITKGDIVFVKGTPYEELEKGDVIVYKLNGGEPIIHRIVRKEDDGLSTKGDNNMNVDQDDNIPPLKSEHIQGRALVRVPFLGYVKILFLKITGRG